MRRRFSRHMQRPHPGLRAATLGLSLAAAISVAGAALVLGGGSGDRLPSQKQAALDRIAHERAVGQADPAPKDPAAGPLFSTNPQPSAAALFPGVKTTAAGGGLIVETGNGPPGAKDSVWLNLWQEDGATRSVAVYAGGVADDPDQGLVVFIVSGPPPAFANTVEQDLPTPTRAGAVRVEAATGEVLTLLATDGTRFTFDAGTGTFR